MRSLAVIACLVAAAPALAQNWPGATQRWATAATPGGIVATVQGDAGSTLGFACEANEEVAGLSITLQLPPQAGPAPARFTAMLGAGGEALPLPLSQVAEAEATGQYRFAPRTANGFRQARGLARAITGPGTGTGTGPGTGQTGSFTLLLPGRAAAERFPLADAALVFASVVQPCGLPYRHAWVMVAGQPNPRIVGSLWLGANSRCRAEAETSADACDERAAYHRRLTGLGWCLGRQGEAPGDRQWHACGPGSLRE